MRGFVAASLPLLLASAAAAQPAPQNPFGVPFGQQTHTLRAVLNVEKVQPLNSLPDLLADPSRGVLIVLGDPRVLESLARSGDLQKYIDDGGSLLLATDRHTSDELYHVIGAGVNGRFESVPPDSESAWKGLGDCPVIQEVRTGRNRHPLFDTLPEHPVIATNKPSFVDRWNSISRGRIDILQPVATLPIRGELSIGGRYIGRTYLQFALARQFRSGGRLLVLADHSIFINDMMLQPKEDNDNIPFAFNVAHWLTDGGKHPNVLYYEDGVLRTDFDVSLRYPTPQLPPADALVPLANQFLADLQADNVLNEMALQAFGSRGALVRTVTLVATLALVIVAAFRFINARHRPEARVPRLPTRLAALAPPVPAVEQRHQALMAQGNLAEAARELARQTFAALGVPATPGAAPPAVAVDGPWWQRRSWGRRVRQFWDLAARGRGRRVTSAELRQLAEGLRELHAAAEGGKLRLAAANQI